MHTTLIVTLIRIRCRLYRGHMTQSTYEVIVVGGGPGGYVASIRLGQLGIKTLCVEKESMGGVCLNWGCIPSKALIAAAKTATSLREAGVMGITATDVSVDVAKMQGWKDGIVKKLTGGVRALVTGNGAEIAMGTAKFTSPRSIEITAADGSTRTVTASKGIIVATGTNVIQIPGFTVDGSTIVTAREAVSFQEAPKHLVVIGGGVIGLELGTVYAKLGSKVTVVELTNNLLPGVDPDVVKVVEKHLKKLGVVVHLGTKALGADVADGSATVRVEKDGAIESIPCDKVLVAVGFKPNTAGLGLDAVGVKLDARGHILVDEQLRSSVPTIFAIGDVRGGPYLAHKASKEGEICAEVIAGHKAALDLRSMPAAIFTDPEISTVGLSETAAKAQGREVKIAKFPFAAMGRAMAVNETDGFFKVIVDPKDNLVLGVSIVGCEASNLISEAALGIEMSAFAEDIALTVHPHPTLGEGMMEAFKAVLGEAVHIMNR